MLVSETSVVFMLTSFWPRSRARETSSRAELGTRAWVGCPVFTLFFENS